MYSLIIPVYKNEGSIKELLSVLSSLNSKLLGKLEVIFVIDGSPDNCLMLLQQELPQATFSATLLALSRNFGSFSAIRAGLAEARGPYFAVMAADLQEPPELIHNFFEALEKEPYDVIVGAREARADPFLTRLFSRLFWKCYRSFVQKDIPPGGIDVFACNSQFRNHLLSLEESNSSLVGLLFWLGFRRKQISYQRLSRKHGKSAWTFKRKLRYFSDSMFSFSDLPIRILTGIGVIGIFFSFIFGIFVIIVRLTGGIHLPGYSTNILLMMFLIGFNSLGLGIIGSYVWRAFENSKQRPASIIMHRHEFNNIV